MTEAQLRREIHANSLHGLTLVGGTLDGVAVDRVGPWLLFDSGTGNADSNQALLCAPAEDATRAVTLAEDWFRTRVAPFTFWLRVPDDGPVIAAAAACGYSEVASQPAMVLAPISQADSAAGLTVVRVTDEAGCHAYASAEAEEADRYGRHHDPDLALARAMLGSEEVRLFVGFLAGRPVARSMVVFDGRMAGLTNVYVAPSARRRGFGEAITRAAIAAGVELGATAACLEASAMGEGLYRKMGFRELYRYVRLGLPGASLPSGAANEA